MGYIIYMDVYFFLNFFMNMLLLCMLYRADGKRYISINVRKIRKMVLGAVSGGILSCLMVPVFGKITFWARLFLVNGIIGYLMIWIAFDYKTFRQRIQAVVRLSLLEIMISGILNMGIKERIFLQKQTSFLSVAGTGVFAVLIMGRVLYCYRKESVIQSHLYEVKLIHRGKYFQGTGLLDTGNHLRDPVSGKAVVISTFPVMEGLLGKKTVDGIARFETLNGEETEPFIKWIPFHSIGKKNGFMPAIVLDEMVIYQEGSPQISKNVLVGIVGEELSAEGKYQIILHEAYIETIK